MGDEATLIESVTEFISKASHLASEMDGRLGFFLGLCTWFLVEQMIRSAVGLFRLTLIVAALSAGGYTVAQLLAFAWLGFIFPNSVLVPFTGLDFLLLARLL